MSGIELTDGASTGLGATHQTARTQLVDVEGVCRAYRRFGVPGATPLA
jgi:hypothetical protein